jgi:phage replication O-like protein O
MANPQVEDGHCDIANELLEAIIKTHFNSEEHSIFWTIVRKTYGWHKKSDRISFSQLEELTGMNRWNIAPTLKRLITRGIIIRTGEGQTLDYGIQKDYENWKPLSKQITKPLSNLITVGEMEPLSNSGKPLSILEKPLSKQITKPLSKQILTKENKTKQIQNKRKGYGGNIPEWINKETWEAYLEMRREKKKPPIPRAVELIIKKLDELRLAGQDVKEILNQSIINSWTDIYPLKQGGNNGKTGINRLSPGQVPATYETPEEFDARYIREFKINNPDWHE